MRRIAIVTNLHEQCGNAAYGRALTKELKKYYTVEVVENFNQVDPGLDELVVVNYHPARVPLSHQMLIDCPRDVIVVYQNTPPSGAVEDWVLRQSYVVTHEILPGCHYIPHGVLEVDRLLDVDPGPCIGTAGFAFPWKNFDAVVQLAKILGVRARIISPPYPGRDFSPDHRRWQDELGDQLELHTDFLPEEEVVRLLSRNWFNVFPFESLGGDDALGQSGAARLGVSAMRPVVLSQHPKLRTLRDFGDSYDYYENLLDVAENLLTDIKQGKQVRRPDEIVRCTGWSVTGKMYRDLIEEVLE